MRLFPVLIAILLFWSCKKQEHGIPCIAYISGIAYDSLSGAPMANVSVNGALTDASGRYKIKYYLGKCKDRIADPGKTKKLRARKRPFFSEVFFPETLLEPGQTSTVDLFLIQAGTIKFTMKDTTSGAYLRGYEYSDLYDLELSGRLFGSTYSNTTLYLDVSPNKEIELRWWTSPSSTTSGILTLPIKNSSPWNYSIKGDTTVVVASEDTISIEAFF